MKEKDKNIEVTILIAAKKVFLKKGYDGARMQEIADEAGINKSLLHYYFRNKEKLFKAILDEALSNLMPKIGMVLQSDKSIFDKLEIIADAYITVLRQNPHLPVFVIHEVQSHPEFILDKLQNMGIDPQKIQKQVQKEIEKGILKPVDFRQVFVSLISMCIFPFIAKSLLMKFLFNNNESEWEKFIEERKKFIPLFIKESLKVR